MKHRDPKPEPKPSEPGLTAQGLTHNPFRALRGKSDGAPADATPAPASSLPERSKETREPEARAVPREARRPPSIQPAGTNPERVTVRRERAGRGGKTVTLVEGPGLARADLGALARAVARAMGVGARVEGGALVVQGDQSERLRSWLEGQGYGSVVLGN